MGLSLQLVGSAGRLSGRAGCRSDRAPGHQGVAGDVGPGVDERLDALGSVPPRAARAPRRRAAPAAAPRAPGRASRGRRAARQPERLPAGRPCSTCALVPMSSFSRRVSRRTSTSRGRLVQPDGDQAGGRLERGEGRGETSGRTADLEHDIDVQAELQRDVLDRLDHADRALAPHPGPERRSRRAGSRSDNDDSKAGLRQHVKPGMRRCRRPR